MTVKRVNRGKRKSVDAAKRRASGENGKVAALHLPAARTAVDRDIAHYTGLIYGREKIGKTTALAGFPNAIFFGTEPGQKGLSIYALNADGGGVKNWPLFLQGVSLLEGGGHDFKTVIVDTVDAAYDMCLDYVCMRRGIEYPGEDESGENDFGKSWRAVAREFSDTIHRIKRAGLSVWFISHAKEQTFRTRIGDRFTRIFPSMGNQARRIVEAVVDMFFYAEYFKNDKGQTVRVLICEGDDSIWAGVRALGGVDFPKILPLQRQQTFEVIQQAFLGKHPGLDPATLNSGKQTSLTGEAFIKRERIKKRKSGGAA